MGGGSSKENTGNTKIIHSISSKPASLKDSDLKRLSNELVTFKQRSDKTAIKELVSKMFEAS